MTQSELLDHLESDLNNLLKQARAQFSSQTYEALLRRAAPEQWSALECFAHLNAQLDHYLPRIERALHKAKARQWVPGVEWRSNGMGRRAIRAVDPANRALKPHRSPKAINPSRLLKVRENEFKVFIINLEVLLRLLRQTREVDTNKPRIRPMGWHLSSFTLGDLLVYLVLHAQRHLLQAQAAAGF